MDQIQNILLTIFGLIIEPYGVGLDRDAALAFEVYVVEQLGLHIGFGDRTGYLQQPVSESRFAVIDVGNDGEISNQVQIHTTKQSKIVTNRVSGCIFELLLANISLPKASIICYSCGTAEFLFFGAFNAGRRLFMGRDYDRDETSAATKLTYLIVGGGIGAILALLFAPKSCVELREDIADATRKGIEKSKEAAAQLQEKAGEYYEVSREKASEFYQTATGKAAGLTEKEKSAAANTANPFSAAIEAGKDAYTAEKRKNESKAITEGRASYPVKDDGEKN